MKIQRKVNDTYILFKELEFGDTFIFGDKKEVLMKLNLGFNHNSYAVIMKNGLVIDMNSGAHVIKINGKFVEE